MNKKKDTFTRSDIEASLRKEFPNLTKTQVTEAINVILESITEAIALDEKVEIRGFGTFSKNLLDPESSQTPKQRKFHI